jgi:hypothetical protein
MIFTQDSVGFISKWKRGREDKIVERQRERGRESVCRLMKGTASVVKGTVRK